MKNSFRLLLISFMIVTFCLAVTISTEAESLNIRVGVVGPVPDFFHDQVATPLELWSDSGLQPKFFVFSSGMPMVEAFAANELDIGIIGGPPVVFANAKFKLPVVAAWDAAGLIQLWVTPEDAKQIVEVGETKWFKGKSIGYTQGTTGHLMIQGYLNNIGLTTKDVKLINLEPGDREQAFLRGDIDVVQSWFPACKILEETGNVLLTTGRDENVTIPSGIVIRERFLEENPEIVIRFLDVHFKLIDLMHNNLQSFAKTQSDWFNKHGITMTAEELVDFHPKVQYYDLDSQIKSFTSKQGQKISYFGQAFQTMWKFFDSQGVTQGSAPDFHEVIDAQVEYLKRLKEFRDK